ncbi:hypothetical protein HIM_10263 [Hirsutella minnesotensis 3608]|uniref:Uncharacterized protein n=1 Tax=Hirsutella minnesotensis 3608 TaxID=1043627 RepID=A0A0F8A2G4_9HYPO|nr:hypothetical protein HIM_10263 [Hirsutella minnesotensis 3608]
MLVQSNKITELEQVHEARKAPAGNGQASALRRLAGPGAEVRGEAHARPRARAGEPAPTPVGGQLPPEAA